MRRFRQTQRWLVCGARCRLQNREADFTGFEFGCQTCGEIHKGMPGFGANAPLSYFAIPEAERASRCELGSDDCVIDHASFFVRGCLEIPVHGADKPLIWASGSR
jgi:hypothetical protein